MVVDKAEKKSAIEHPIDAGTSLEEASPLGGTAAREHTCTALPVPLPVPRGRRPRRLRTSDGVRYKQVL